MHRLGLLTAPCKSANPEIKHTINLNKNIKNPQHQKLKSLCVHTCWSFSSPAQQLANSCTPCLSLISILKTNILKNTPHKKPFWRSLAGFQGISKALLVLEFQKRDRAPPEPPPCSFSFPEMAAQERSWRQEIAWEWAPFVLLPALPDFQGVKWAANTVPRFISFSTPAKTRKYQRGDFAGKESAA